MGLYARNHVLLPKDFYNTDEPCLTLFLFLFLFQYKTRFMYLFAL
jgi:hypothetical protein